jgi:hypothetical protein
MFTTGPAFFGANAGSVPGLLFPFYPTILYSFRLRNGLYTGKCCQVRNDANSLLFEIGFNPTTGVVSAADISTALAGTPSANLLVTKWYDQGGGGRDAVNATALQQPALVLAGTPQQTTGGFTCPAYNGTAQRLVAPNSTDLDMGTGDFAIEMLMDTVINSQNRFFDMRPGGSGNQAILYLVSGTLNLFVSGANTVLAASGITGLSNVALTRSGSSNRGFVAGVQKGSTLSNSQNMNGTALTMGNDGVGSAASGVQGHIFEVRITKGSAVQTANYTPWSTS